MRCSIFGLACLPAVRPSLVLLLGFSSAGVAAQAVSGTILGIVSDPTGGSIAGTRITLAHVSTGLARTIQSDADGNYTAPLLVPGVYNLSGEAAGFKAVSITSIQLGVDQKVRIDLRLEVGDLKDSVTVRAENPLVQRASSDLSATLSESQIQSLPLSGRNFVQLTRTIPGVVRGVPGENIDGSGGVGWRHSASFAANGQRPRDNNFLLDGVDNNEVWLNTVAVFPSIEALAEFKVQTSTSAAEFGRSMGGVVNLQTKSGSNAFRGSLFEFLRDDRFDANDWFNNRAGRPRPDFSQH